MVSRKSQDCVLTKVDNISERNEDKTREKQNKSYLNDYSTLPKFEQGRRRRHNHHTPKPIFEAERWAPII
jgi:hypothetical protein